MSHHEHDEEIEAIRELLEDFKKTGAPITVYTDDFHVVGGVVEHVGKKLVLIIPDNLEIRSNSNGTTLEIEVGVAGGAPFPLTRKGIFLSAITSVTIPSV